MPRSRRNLCAIVAWHRRRALMRFWHINKRARARARSRWPQPSGSAVAGHGRAGFGGAGTDERELERVGQGLGARLDDVGRDTDGAPAVAAVSGLDEDAGLGAGGRLGIEDAHLEVREL